MRSGRCDFNDLQDIVHRSRSDFRAHPAGPTSSPGNTVLRLADAHSTSHSPDLRLQSSSPKAFISSPHRETLFALSDGFLSAGAGADRVGASDSSDAWRTDAPDFALTFECGTRTAHSDPHSLVSRVHL